MLVMSRSGDSDGENKEKFTDKEVVTESTDAKTKSAPVVSRGGGCRWGEGGADCTGLHHHKERVGDSKEQHMDTH